MLAGEVLRSVTGLSGKGTELFKESVLEKKRKKYRIVSLAGEKIKEKVSAKENREVRAREKNKVVSKEKWKQARVRNGQKSKERMEKEVCQA